MDVLRDIKSTNSKLEEKLQSLEEKFDALQSEPPQHLKKKKIAIPPEVRVSHSYVYNYNNVLPRNSFYVVMSCHNYIAGHFCAFVNLALLLPSPKVKF